jgi:hypothetical protein
MRVSDIQVFATGDGCELHGRVTSEAEPDAPDWFAPFTLWYRFPAWCLPFLSPDNGDPFLAALLLPAMRTRERLHIAAPVSTRLLEALSEIQAIYAAFDPRTTRVPVEASARDESLPSDGSQPRVGLFFSMGVDSFYSLLKNQRDHPAGEQAVTHLISVHGFDAAHDGWDDVFPATLLKNFERVARETGTSLTPVGSNVRQVGARLAPWTMLHGGAMASVALALGAAWRRVMIAASATYDTIYPWGTHPLLDPLWSTEGLTVVHDGCELGTIDKTRFVARSQLVLDTLRVCPGYSRGYNCGRCMKCLRTMIDLLQAGKLRQSQTLPHEIDAEMLRNALRMPGGPVHIANFRRRLETLAASNTRPDLQAVIAEHLANLDAAKGASPARIPWLWKRIKWRRGG